MYKKTKSHDKKEMKEQVASKLEDITIETEELAREEKIVPLNQSEVTKMDETHVKIENQMYEIVMDYREGFNTEAIVERHNTILNKYDYIVGDWGYDQLRLKGFFDENNNRAPFDKKIDFLEDYLYEYCNFGCAYFVLEKEKSEKPKKAKTQRKRKSKKPLSKDEKIRSTVKATPIEQKKVKPKSKTAKSENENKSQEIDQSKEFVIKKAEKKRTTTKRKEKNLKEQIKKEDQPNEQKQENPKTDFKIHTVKDENK